MKLIIFDLDGTLLDTIADLAASTNYALASYGYPTHETDAYRFFVGNGINKLFERALPEGERTPENVLKIRSRFIPYYNAHKTDFSKPYPGIEDLLRQLKKEGILLAVASNKYHEATCELIDRFFPGVFSRILGQREGIPAKPDPQIVDEIVSSSGIGKEETIYIGDSCVDMQTGINAKVTTIGVSWGFRPREELEAYHPALIADSAADILRFVHKS